MNILVRIGYTASLLGTAASHAYLYVHGYQHIPMIGTAFLVQASVSVAVAVLIALGGPWWLRWAAAAIAGGSLVAFALSRTVGLFGFTERGWDPSPYAAISVGAEVITVLLWMLTGYSAGVRIGWLRKARSQTTSA
jgi:F0F1-type ATP synthase assembly protein I